MSAENHFAKLAKINVSAHIEKKNGMSYLSWPYAVSELMHADPMANWTFHPAVAFGETLMVSCTVTAFGKPITMHLPVMDHRNTAIKNPDAFQVNKNMMRCLVKAIACHGLGLYIYAGEDMPEAPEPSPLTDQQRQTLESMLNSDAHQDILIKALETKNIPIKNLTEEQAEKLITWVNSKVK